MKGNDKLDKWLSVAKKAAIEAGLEILKVYHQKIDVEFKKDNSPLTIADKKANDIIEKYLLTTNIPILSEEGRHATYQERKNWNLVWIVDPLDGTKEFVKRNGEFTVNIALIHNGNPIMGIIYVPVKEELYFAMEGLGSYKVNINSVIDDLEELISTSDKLPINYDRDNYVIVGSRSHMSAETEVFFDEMKKEHGSVEVMAVGSSLKLCMVAEGKADAYPRYAPTMEWDTGAGHAIAKYAGFSVKQYNSQKDVIYNKEDLLNPWFLVK